VPLFLLDSPSQSRLKVMGHARVLKPDDDALLDNDKALHLEADPA